MLCNYDDVTTSSKPLGTFVSLYCGAGGLDVGFALAGFMPVWANDIDRTAVETYRRALKRLHDRLPHLADLVHEPVAGELDLALRACPPPSATLVIGGPPCQGFSVAGKMDPADPRSRHVFRFFDVVGELKPEGFVMENVRALYDNRRWVQLRVELQERAERAGYRASMFLLKASDYGVPQFRERMFFVGVRDGCVKPPLPVTRHNPPTLRDALEQLPPYGKPGNDSLCRARITLARSPVLRRSPWAGMLFNGAGRPMDLDRPAPTLPASMGGNKTPIIDQDQLGEDAEPWVVKYHRHLWSGGRPRKRIPATLRRITVEEASAIQTFEVGMEWVGQQSAQYRQIGNAVPPRLAYHVAKAVSESLELTPRAASVTDRARGSVSARVLRGGHGGHERQSEARHRP